MADVLIVDDDAIGETARMNLELEGIPSREVRDGREAVGMAAERAPGVVLTDIMMPALDGAGFCRELAAREVRDASSIVVMTGAARARHSQGECRADATLGKPFEVDALAGTVRRNRGAAG